MNSKTFFFDETNTLRSGWRFAVFVLLFVPFVAMVFAATYPVVSALTDKTSTSGQMLSFVYGSAVMLVPAVGVGWFCGWKLERLPFRALGVWFTPGWFGHFASGCVIGIFTFFIALLVAAAGGGLSFSLNTEGAAYVVQSLSVSLLVFAVAAASEEALFRGYILQTFTRSGLAWLAVIMTSLFFGWAHLKNPNVGWISVLNTALAGVWFGVAYLKTRDLWFVWGLHLVWNWLQGAVFGIEVSGLTEITRSPVLRELDSGPAWLTGGDYGIEGGLACTAALILSTAAIYFLPNIKPHEEMLTLTSPKQQTSSLP